MNLTEKLKAQHLEFRRKLEACAQLTPPDQLLRLRALGPEVLAHLDYKDRLYDLAQKSLRQRGDAGGSHLLGIFEQNMHVVTGGIRAFFTDVNKPTSSAPILAQRFVTIADVMRQNFETEEKAVLPIFARCQDTLA